MHVLPLTVQTAWQFRDQKSATWLEANVPGCVHRDLLRHHLIPDPFWGRNEQEVQWVGDRDWEYRADFHASMELLEHEHVELVADGLDTLATVLINGREVGRSDNMFTPLRVPIRNRLRPGRNTLTIQFASAQRFVATQRQEHRPREINDPVGGATRLRKQQCQFGWDWAPRLVTAGIWRDIRLEAWCGNRLTDVRVVQEHRRDGSVKVTLAPQAASGDRPVRYAGRVRRNGRVVAELKALTAVIKQPALWWPSGQGGQPLYVIELEMWDGAVLRDTWSRRIGLRTLALERKPDRWGESFNFVVNGRRVFAMGASWIPAHSFVGGLTRDDYEPLLRSAVQANMNMLRVWGGGVYEHDCFYDLCDELGLMVWHDFMFACTLYPGDAAFLNSVEREAECQITRLRHRASLALWCGNNELELLNGSDLKKAAPRAAYRAVFRRILPRAVARLDGVRPYWRSSPSQSERPELGNPERSGNTHYWDVWHLLKPVKSYEEKVFRFVSEFGMQSFPSAPVAETFCPPGERNVFSAVMENHQKNPAGNKIILEYLSRRYRFPKDYASLAFLSQLNQAHCLQVGVEHYRRNQPRCMGTLYWQLNDCWPVASWSSLEFGGRWKVLHHVARRFYAPLLVSAHVHGDDTVGIGNRLKTTIRHVDLHTICNAPAACAGRLTWELWHLDGRVLSSGAKGVRLRPGESRRQKELDLGGPMAEFGRENIYLRIALEVSGTVVSEESVLLGPPRLFNLKRGTPRIDVRRLTPCCYEVGFTSAAFLHRYTFDLPGLPVASVADNCFDLHPGRRRTVRIEFRAPVSAQDIRRGLAGRSLVDTYE